MEPRLLIFDRVGQGQMFKGINYSRRHGLVGEGTKFLVLLGENRLPILLFQFSKGGFQFLGITFCQEIRIVQLSPGAISHSLCETFHLVYISSQPKPIESDFRNGTIFSQIVFLLYFSLNLIYLSKSNLY